MKRIIKLTFSILLSVLLSVPQLGMAQDKFVKVSGKVVDEDGLPVPGASIRVEGTKHGTASDFDGNYSIRAKVNAVLMVTYIGFQNQRIQVLGRKQIDIALEPDVQTLDEMVVIGYGKQDAKEVSGSIQSVVMSEEINSMPAASFDQMMQGRMAGVQVSSGEGGPGQSMNFEIRGANTITGSSAPLYVVDGFPLEDPTLFSLDPSDIERVDVLKDASATAIYGSRASNGVILITTKQGTSGKPVITFNTKMGMSQVPENRILKTLSPQEYVNVQHEIGGGDAWGDASNYTDADYTNWQDEIFRQAPFQNYTVSMKGGSDQTKVFTSIGYVNQEGTLLRSSFERINGRLKLDQSIGKHVDMNLNLNYANSKTYGMKTSTAQVSAIKSAIMFRPMTPKNGDLDDEDELSAGFYPPTSTLNNTDRMEEVNMLQSNVNFTVRLAEGLSFRTQLGYQMSLNDTKTFFNLGTNQADRGSDGINGSLAQVKSQNYLNENVLMYNFNKNGHKFETLAGMSFQITERFRQTAAAIQFPLDDLGWNNMGMANMAVMPGSSATQQNLMSGFGRVSYSYNNKYIVTASLRADGSSRFKEGNRFGIFPSASAAWRAGEEDFVKNWGVFDELKFKAGFGTTGNNRVGDFDFLPTMSVAPGYYFNGYYQAAFYQTQLANTNLKWETTQQFNVGTDMGFFNNRLQVDVEYYYNLTDNLLFDAKVAPSTGYQQVKQNIGAVLNHGLELSVNTVNVQTKNFQWSTNFNISFNDNEIKKLSYGEDYRLYDPNVGGMFAGELYYGLFVGMPMTQMYGYRYDGIYQVDDFVKGADGQLRLKEGVPGFNSQTGEVRPGLPKYKDVNGDGVIDENDKEIIGNPNPRYFGGLSNTFTYKNWDLSVLLTWTVGQDVFNGNMADFGVVGNQRGRNYLADVGNRWQMNNPINEGVWAAPGPTQEYTYQQVYGGHQMSDYFIEDASFLRIKNITLGYTFNKDLLKKLKIKNFRIYGSVDNLWVFTNYTGYDPEVSVRNQAMYKGIDYSSYPAAQSAIIGLQVGF
ncbi:SusC/RagA family TonB-linked outer membrane protein [Flammeovirga yaeyamensis]|uniref:SusC/RagA family TonB-linked outer membrane protein n=1 Tax=Flammeovirga yaeyamensis TaxID=367791 RepID=A0AAX1NDF6_9BACT|nr:TonB-dependent receptor [Flammeovirga yaeyamensis]MBB3697086.1 TonB-linked SusC/RagA family outer membrane protein [Flammeovirga yaeyamensis]NMF33748.1 TonB-dependent receptor [Flammeovirga yaeyamensis]QWG04986.1 SusC/RagA family TonB-linked outer membrane protein [Flammeovirga yaeyamensis]